MNKTNRTRVSIYLPEQLDTHIKTLKKAWTEEMGMFPPGISHNQFIQLILGVGCDELTKTVRELQELPTP